MTVKNTENLKFYDVSSKKKFVPKTYTVKVRNGRRFGVAKNPNTGSECWRVLGMNTKKKSKK